MLRTKVCPTCGNEFSYIVSRGNDRKHCTAACRQANQIASRKANLVSKPTCSVDGCESKATRVSAGMCEMHYGRRRRTGSTDKADPAYRYNTGRGYITLLKAEHPLADSMGRVPEHRMVLYAAIGGGAHACHWCGASLQWSDLVVDHLNEVKNDNSRANLVPSCNDCNRARGAMLPFLRRLRPEVVEQFVMLARKQTSVSVIEADRDAA